ncbi:reactivating factor for ethanolamine ammonia lyase [Oxalobacteraceae bacterium CAVE-383]|nr:reactivating factor for ethanolamine ammonia lyase [Oxalobacteraceae bacterium CAVE-383]
MHGGRFAGIRLHDDGEEHFHELSDEEKDALAKFIWREDNIELTTVGIDIGSSTSHLMFAKVHLQRKSKSLSSGYIVVNRTILWKSSILLTPFLPDNSIDAGRLNRFIQDAYRAAGLERDDIDSGAVILTGEAIKRSNAEAIAALFAADSGKFVCASAGHHLECMLAAQGSGAAAISRATHRTVLNVDIGGGTTKFARIKNGVVVATCAVAVGGRLIVRDADLRCTRLDQAAQQTADSLGLRLQLGGAIDNAAIDRIADALAEVVIACIRGEPPGGLAQTLLLTEELAMDRAPDLITFSGGVSEYLFNRETRDYGDIAKPLAGRIGRAFADGRIKAALTDPGNGIRATVIGASQFTVQVSGKTIHLSRNVPLPLHNVPVIFPRIAVDRPFCADDVVREIRAALKRSDLDAAQTVAVAIRWRGDPYYSILRTLANGIAVALDNTAASPLILVIDGDVGKVMGNILEYELKVLRPVVSVDGVQLDEMDFVDIGALIEPAYVVPIVIKSLLFTPTLSPAISPAS